MAAVPAPYESGPIGGLLLGPWLDAKTGDPKGFAPYNPTATWKLGVIVDVLQLFDELHADDALPVGPRTTGYMLSQRENASGLRYVKRLDPKGDVEHRAGVVSFKPVEDTLKRLRQAETMLWEWVSDGSAVAHPVSEFTDAESFARKALDPDAYQHDLRAGQPLVIELHSESAELTTFLRRVCAPLGVRVESGRGSGGPDLARKVAIRTWLRYRENQQRTLILGIGDLDVAGVQNVMRPHVEHVGAFLLGLAEQYSRWDEALRREVVEDILDFRRVAITPEQAITLGLPGVDVDALEGYRRSGDDDWTRDLSLLDAKIEVEALGPQRLRAAVIEAIEETLDPGVLEQAREDEQTQRQRVGEMRSKLGLDEEMAS